MKSVAELIKRDMSRMKRRSNRAQAEMQGRGGRLQGKGKAAYSHRASGGKRAR